MIDDKDRGLVLEIKKRLPPDLESKLKRLIIFGSRVKGESAEDSDLDIIALVNKKTPEVEKKLDDIVYQVMWDYDFKPIISLKVLEESNYIDALNKGFSFYLHVEREGVAV
jgi:predicted nucleotidyltransferase